MRLPSLYDLVRSPAAMGALLVNVAPLIGVLAWGWKGGALVVLYWLENLVVGVINIARMAASGAANGPGGLGAVALLVPFFCVHYGLFCFVHGMFVMLLFARESGFDSLDAQALLSAALNVAPHMGIVIGIIAAWKAALFVLVFLREGEYRRTNPMELFAAPYSRIIFIHIAIFAGAFALMALGEPIVGVIALVLVKAAYDAVSEFLEAKRRREGLKPAAGSAAPRTG